MIDTSVYVCIDTHIHTSIYIYICVYIITCMNAMCEMLVFLAHLQLMLLLP